MPIAPLPVDLAEICRQVADEFRAAHPDREIRVEVEGDVTGRWDPDRLAQALANLCKNALDYGAPREPVDVRAAGREGSVEVTVANTGAPIPADVLPTLFDPYRRASSREHRTGLGLGLFIVREIARAHGGTVEPRSLNGRVEFSLHLPRLRRAEGSEASSRSPDVG
jgi:signal transduction histidine kinase